MANEKEFTLYRGLQKPYEIFGLRGVNVYWGAGAAGGAMLFFGIGYFTSGLVLGLILAVIPIAFCIRKISYHLKYGLHDKRKYPGIWVPKNLIRSNFRGKAFKKG